MPLPILAIVGLGVSVAWTATIAALNAGKVVVPRAADWDGLIGPFVIDPLVAASALEPFTESQRLWEKHGHKFASPAPEVRVPRPGERCIYVGPPTASKVQRHNAVSTARVVAEWADQIDMDEEPDLSSPSPRDTHMIDTDEQGRIERVDIIWDELVLAGFDLKRVACHETGHALGFLHCTAKLGRKHIKAREPLLQIPKRGHLMNPHYEMGGYSMTGLDA